MTTRDTSAEAQDLTDSIRSDLDGMADIYEAVVPKIARAFEIEAWVSLGYRKNGSAQWIQDHFGAALGRLDSEVRREMGSRLKADVPQLSTRGLAALTGVSHPTIVEDQKSGQDLPDSDPEIDQATVRWDSGSKVEACASDLQPEVDQEADRNPVSSEQVPEPDPLDGWSSASEALADREDDQEPPDLFSCGYCPEDGFSVEVWHCPGCAHHWVLDDDECRNCHQWMISATGLVQPVEDPGESQPQKAKKPRRGPIRDEYRNAGLDLDRIVRRYQRLVSDDRTKNNKGEAVRWRNDLAHAIDALQRVHDELPAQEDTE